MSTREGKLCRISEFLCRIAARAGPKAAHVGTSAARARVTAAREGKWQIFGLQHCKKKHVQGLNAARAGGVPRVQLRAEKSGCSVLRVGSSNVVETCNLYCLNVR